jgi:hypothetical protein
MHCINREREREGERERYSVFFPFFSAWYLLIFLLLKYFFVLYLIIWYLITIKTRTIVFSIKTFSFADWFGLPAISQNYFLFESAIEIWNSLLNCSELHICSFKRDSSKIFLFLIVVVTFNQIVLYNLYHVCFILVLCLKKSLTPSLIFVIIEENQINHWQD